MKLKLLLLSITVCFTAILYMSILHSNNKKTVNCDVELEVLNERKPDLNLKLHMNYTINKGFIFVRTEGILSNGIKKMSVSRSIYLKVLERSASIYTVINKKVSISAGDSTNNQDIYSMLPLIYNKEGEIANLTIYNQNNNDLIIAIGHAPSLYCNKEL